jgi:hypothetical protein
VDVVELLLHDGAAVAQLGEGLRKGTAEPAAHTCGQNHYLGGHINLLLVSAGSAESSKKTKDFAGTSSARLR